MASNDVKITVDLSERTRKYIGQQEIEHAMDIMLRLPESTRQEIYERLHQLGHRIYK